MAKAPSRNAQPTPPPARGVRGSTLARFHPQGINALGSHTHSTTLCAGHERISVNGIFFNFIAPLLNASLCPRSSNRACAQGRRHMLINHVADVFRSFEPRGA